MAEAQEPRKPLLSVLVPSHRNCLEAMPIISRLAALRNERVEVLVADNSGDPHKQKVLDILLGIAPRLKVVKNPDHLPPHENYKTIIDIASGDYILACADDDYLDPDFIDAAIKLIMGVEHEICVMPALYQYIGQGQLYPTQRIQEPAAPEWTHRVIGHFESKIMPVLTYSVVPKRLLAAFLNYQRYHPMIGSFLDWSFEYFARAWCPCFYADNGFYLYDSQRWMNIDSATEADGRQYRNGGLPFWFVAFHKLHWAVELSSFLYSGYFPGTPQEREPLIKALIAQNMGLFRYESCLSKRERFESAPVSAGIKREIMTLFLQSEWSYPEILAIFLRLLGEVAPGKALRYEKFIHAIQTPRPGYTGFPDPAAIDGVSDNYLCPEAKPQDRENLISIVVSLGPYTDKLLETLDSLVGQTCTDWEIILVGDPGSKDTDHSIDEVLAYFPGRAIRVIATAGLGWSESRNAGIQAALGKYILPVNCGDKLHPRALEKLSGLLQAEPFAIAYSDIQEFGTASRYIETWGPSAGNPPLTHPYPYCALYRREMWATAGGYNLDMAQDYADWDFWLSCAGHGYRGRHLPEALLFRRTGEADRVAGSPQRETESRARLVLNHRALYDPSMLAQAEALLAEPPSQGGKQEVLAVIAEAERLTATEGLAAAVAHYRRWLWFRSAASPLAYAVQFNLGVALQQLDDPAGAARAYRQALENNPGFAPARNNLALLPAP
ncbi:Glycosyltransferase involved in cell wall bisynthesis [Methylomagnum ishizawai]|uniref:Glycosyltransferase involved in cell wall bisynthesis n=1 Tax=Methylomagnum ishizawai TaxID=1760988 RepID=A0A1Y6D0F2_9GAMM|nr:glycosyltransferase [Methylomagnum ishizawai]SMF96419.1 Glycosyltransferase involved in cell wall bisynthesis [Methylomagnum ishizawai]